LIYKSFFFNLSNFFKMKKLILSMVMVAICGLANAATAVETPTIEKEALEVSATIEDSQISEEEVECSGASIPICDGGEAVAYINVTICAESVVDFLDSMQC
jgi:hypothetical protein